MNDMLWWNCDWFELTLQMSGCEQSRRILIPWAFTWDADGYEYPNCAYADMSRVSVAVNFPFCFPQQPYVEPAMMIGAQSHLLYAHYTLSLFSLSSSRTTSVRGTTLYRQNDLKRQYVAARWTIADRRVPSGCSENPISRGRPHDACFSSNPRGTVNEFVIVSPLPDAHLTILCPCVRAMPSGMEWPMRSTMWDNYVWNDVFPCSSQHRTFHSSRRGPS